MRRKVFITIVIPTVLKLGFVVLTFFEVISMLIVLNMNAGENTNRYAPAIKTSPKVHGYNDDDSQNNLGFNEDKEHNLTNCIIPDDPRYPYCKNKVQNMQLIWRDDACYQQNGVDGSQCSYLYYLSEIRHECPSTKWSQAFNLKIRRKEEQAITNTNMNSLMSKLGDYRYDWFRQRIQENWHKWMKAMQDLEKKHLKTRVKKKIIVYIGSLEYQEQRFLPRGAYEGGALGELVQWSDLISSLFILGHEVTVQVDSSAVQKLLFDGSTCPKPSDPDIIFTDVPGAHNINILRTDIDWPRYKCKIRVLDTFGTEPQFNHPEESIPNNLWGKLGLHLKQFMTLFPHSPDNTFLGFVVDEDPKEDTSKRKAKKQRALIYANRKDHVILPGEHEVLMDILSQHFEIHATLIDFDVTEDATIRQQLSTGLDTLPSYLINHGLLNQTQFIELLEQTKVFIGMGFPYEGPAPLEAVAHGAIFIQPKFDPAKSRGTDDLFKGKPSLRELTSQNPYSELSIGEPHVFTIEYRDRDEVSNTVKQILQIDTVAPYLSYEYTFKGMVERVSAHLQNFNLCTGKQWPPLKHFRSTVSQRGESCKYACQRQGLLCESAFFNHINNKETIKKLFKEATCKFFKMESSFFAPAHDINAKTCILQTDQLKFSCADAEPLFQRFCPCREFLKEQA